MIEVIIFLAVVALVFVLVSNKTKRDDIAREAKQAAEWAVSPRNPNSPNYDPTLIDE